MLYRYLRPYIPNTQFTVSSSIVVPAGVSLLTFPWIIGGGGGGGGGYHSTSGTSGGGGGGGSGGYRTGFTLAVTPGDVININIGLGGVPGVISGNGGDTYITQNGTEVVRSTGGHGGSDEVPFQGGNYQGGPGGSGGSPNGTSGGSGSTGALGNLSVSGGAGKAGPMPGSLGGTGGVSTNGTNGTGYGSSGGGGGGSGGGNGVTGGGRGVAGYVQIVFS